MGPNVQKRSKVGWLIHLYLCSKLHLLVLERIEHHRGECHGGIELLSVFMTLYFDLASC